MTHALTRSLFLAATLAACTTDDNAHPEISSLTYSPSTLTVGQQATISGTLVFEDPDADVETLTGEIVMPNNTRVALQTTQVGALGKTNEGTLAWAMVVVPPTAGSYSLELWVYDAEGAASNRLTATFAVQ